MTTNYSIRQLSPLDQEFLWEMLFQSLHVPADSEQFAREVVSRRELAKYVKSWGSDGDLSFVAVDRDSRQPIGVAWLRLLTGDDRGYGYVDDATPELGMAVLAEYRGQGIGSDLLKCLLKSAASLYRAVSLSVSKDNPAVRLYERMGFKRVEDCGTSVTMLKMLDS
jgi:[ribosomal protein S18]-alanine N-acetyltransferase